MKTNTYGMCTVTKFDSEFHIIYPWSEIIASAGKIFSRGGGAPMRNATLNH
jgi:hypothetical protein